MAPPILALESRITYGVIVTALGLAFAGTRLWFRYFVDKRPRTNVYILGDVLVVVAVMGALVYFACNMAGLQILVSMEGKQWLWRHLLKYRVETLKTGYWMTQAYVLSLWAIKGSFVCLYADAGVGMSRKAYWFMMFTTVYTVFSGLVAYGVNAFSCWPIKRYWSIHLDSCANIYYFHYLWATSIAHLSSDILIMLMGLVIVSMSAGMRRAEHYAVLFIFSLAFVTIAAACVRLAVQLNLMNSLTSGAILANSELGDKISRWIAVASMGEMNLGIITVALPTMRVWLRRRRKKREREMSEFRLPLTAGMGYGQEPIRKPPRVVSFSERWLMMGRIG